MLNTFKVYKYAKVNGKDTRLDPIEFDMISCKITKRNNETLDTGEIVFIHDNNKPFKLYDRVSVDSEYPN